MKLFRVLPILFVGLGAPPVLANETLLLGVLEEPQCHRDVRCDYGRDKACVAALERKARPLFARSPEGWMPLDSQPAAERIDMNDLAWTIAFDGRNLGAARTVNPGFHSNLAWTYSRDFVLDLHPGQSLPEIVNKSRGFGGWCDIPARRPIVLVSQPNFTDPDRWKPFKPDAGYRDRLREPFRRAADGLISCTGEPYGIRTDDLILFKSYRDRTGRELVSIALRSGVFCSDDPAVADGRPHWFFVDGSVRYLGNQMELIDAGDYDGNGKAEVLFWFSSYNRDGYTLFYDDFRGRVDFHWGYH